MRVPKVAQTLLYSNSTPDVTRQSQLGNPIVASYLGLRKAVGVIGCCLPFVLVLGALMKGYDLQGSISSYYYTNMGDVFVGSLCAIGIFLMSCKGYDQRDALAGHLAWLFAFGVAFFPTTPESGATVRDKIIGGTHLTCATLLFSTLAYFCLKLFTETSKPYAPTNRKLLRNALYKACGWIIITCIAFIAIFKSSGFLANLKPTLFLESIAILAFGFAWLTKGEAILKDEEPKPVPEQVAATHA
jgi:hypothetical protein